MEDNPLYTAERTLLRFKYSLSEISDKLGYLGENIYNGMNDTDSAKEASELSREVHKLAKSINLSITE